jgi:transcriptional regulator with GAF, ATPase, and Fis domain
LDEIGEMSLSAQSKLLRVLEDGEVRRIGETRVEYVDVRIVTATNVDLEQAVRAGRFRTDLYHRLRGLEIRLPTLAERLCDIPVLAEHYLSRINSELNKSLELSFETKQWLMGLPWPGNVRELRLSLERAAAIGPESGELLPYHFVTESMKPAHKPLPLELEEIERARVINALEAAAWNVTAASRLLGMTRTTLSGRIKRLGIRRPGRE